VNYEKLHAGILSAPLIIKPFFLQNLVPEGEVGEIFISGQGLAGGYIGCHSYLNAFLPNPFQVPNGLKADQYSKLYQTGDFGRICNGRVYYEARQDMQVRNSS
jgi:non-ribosomal peptide synthetase component F